MTPTRPAGQGAMASGGLPDALLAILRCPKCKGQVRVVTRDGGAALECPACRLQYAIRDGIPIMLVDDARQV
ncbi:MAG: Trm112 family protein [Gemmatimonadaceae bacterium]|nr:Trm112 family protein [Gemmatimonadaceae bacterium]